jgi:hypothetical protein
MQKTIKEIIKKRLIDSIFSRKFIAFSVAVIAFFLTDKFSENSLVITIGIYCGVNTVEAIVSGMKNGKQSGQADD